MAERLYKVMWTYGVQAKSPEEAMEITLNALRATDRLWAFELTDTETGVEFFALSDDLEIDCDDA